MVSSLNGAEKLDSYMQKFKKKEKKKETVLLLYTIYKHKLKTD